LLFLLSSPAKCRERLPGQFVGRDDKHAVRFGIGNLDDPQKPARGGLAQGNPRSTAPCPIFTRFFQNLHDLVFIYLVVVDVR
jgi:hypothetical protein